VGKGKGLGAGAGVGARWWAELRVYLDCVCCLSVCCLCVYRVFMCPGSAAALECLLEGSDALERISLRPDRKASPSSLPVCDLSLSRARARARSLSPGKRHHLPCQLVLSLSHTHSFSLTHTHSHTRAFTYDTDTHTQGRLHTILNTPRSKPNTKVAGTATGGWKSLFGL